VPAKPLEALAVTDVPQPGEQPPTEPQFFVRVLRTGDIADLRVKTPSNHDDITAFALAVARQASYQPATKAGQPVDAWVTVTVAVHLGGGTAAAVTQPAQCRNAGYNPRQVCWDTRPAPLSPLALPWSGQGMPTPATFWVQVSATGAAERVQPLATSSDTEFSRAALAAAQTMKFNPAQKKGQPVEAWTQIAIIPQPSQ
jgi:TonB family protein